MTPGSRHPVRPMAPRDLDRVVALWTALTDHHVALDPLFELRPGADSEIRALLAAQLRNPDVATFVCEREDGLAGFCSVEIDRAPPILLERERAEITDLGVREGLRRQGIGSALVAAAYAWVSGRGVKRVEVRVATRNAEGQAFWRALGFDDRMDVLQRRL